MKHRHRVVIVGGGAGGLELATQLGDRIGGSTDVTLIERNRTHVWKPKLHAIAAGSMTFRRTRWTTWHRRTGTASGTASAP